MNRFHITIVGAAACLAGISSIAAAPGVGEPYRRHSHAPLQYRLTPSGADLNELFGMRLRTMGPVTILPSLPAQADPGLAPLFPGAEVDPRTGRIRIPGGGVCILPTYPAQIAPGQDLADAPLLSTFDPLKHRWRFLEPEFENLFVPNARPAPEPE
jgi:hypothetical protein